MNKLEQQIHDEIINKGPISLSRFIELSLYAPGLGYYEKQREVGRGGDFYTNVSVGTVFGELMAFQISQWLDELEGSVQLIEAGAHDGRLARDILSFFRDWRPELYERCELLLLEPSLIRRSWQEETLADFESKVKWSSGGIADFQGVFLANELLDAFPVEKLRWNEKRQAWFQMGVAIEEGRLVEVTLDESNFCANIFEGSVPDGCVMVENVGASKFWGEICSAMRGGRAVALDYFLEREEFFLPPRVNGTLRAYHQHRRVDDLLVNIGDQDITASVDLHGIRVAASAAVVDRNHLSTQEKFFVDIFSQIAGRPKDFPEWTPERTRQLQTLVHPEHLGRTFKVFECWRS